MWQTVNVTFREFQRDPRCAPGVVVAVQRENDTVEHLVLGDVNTQGGGCNCCTELGGSEHIIRVLDLRDAIAVAVTEASQ